MSSGLICPLCNHAINVDEEIILTKEHFVSKETPNENYEIEFEVYQCPNCDEVFINKWHQPYGAKSKRYYICSFPCLQADTKFDERIENISLDFVKTFNQAVTAESNGLTEITGLAYRKSFEILVKDYAIILNQSEDADKILKLSLKQTIDKYFKNSEFEPIFRKISWLGNDHSHTFNKHDDYNVSDLKRFINACVSKIISQLDLEELDKIEPKNN